MRESGRALMTLAVVAACGLAGACSRPSAATATANDIPSVAVAKATRDHVVPAIRNLDDPDDEAMLDLVRMAPRTLTPGGAALSNSFGFGGHDVALVLTEV